ncbi:unnamed protein product, partial [Trichobilharzia regenti]
MTMLVSVRLKGRISMASLVVFCNDYDSIGAFEKTKDIAQFSELCNDYDSIDAFEKTKDIAQFSEDKPSVNER